MRCNVVLFGEGETQNFSCTGELFLFEGSFSLSYFFGFDPCFLTYNGELLTHKKSGEIPVSIEFAENKKTLCKIGNGEFSGKIHVFTKSLIVQKDTRKISVEVVYELDGEERQMKISAESF